MEYFTAGGYGANLPPSVFAAQWNEIICLWISLSFSEAFGDTPRYLTS